MSHSQLISPLDQSSHHIYTPSNTHNPQANCKLQIQPTLSQASMDDNDINRRKKSISGDSFSFPSTPNQDSDFEFGSLTPDSPSTDPCRTSPADHIFFNGRLQPHSFPVTFQQQYPIGISTTSRTSSISSKDSLVSSRSNSTNSRGSSSCSSSARTGSSDTSERRLFHNKVSSSSYGKSGGANMVNRSMVSQHQAYGCSQRWQYITPVPVLNRDASKRRRGDNMQQGKKKKKEEDEGTKKSKKKKQQKKVSSGVRLRFGRRILRWFVMACRECHAIEPSKVSNKEIVLQENVNI